MNNRRFNLLVIVIGVVVMLLLSWLVPAPIFEN